MAPTPATFLKTEARPARRALLFSVLLALSAGGLMMLGAWLLACLVNGLIFSAGAVATMPWMLIGTLLAVYATRAGLQTLADRLAFTGAAQIKAGLRRRIARHLLNISPLHQKSTGSLINSYIEGLDALEAYYAGYLPSRIVTLFIPLAIIVVVLPQDMISALVMLVTAPLIPIFMILIGRGAEKLNQRQWRRLSSMSGRFLDLVQGMITLKLFGAGKREGRLLARIGDDYRQETMAVLRVAFLSSLVLEFFATVSIAVVAVLIGFRLLWGSIDFAHGFFVLLLAPEFYLPLRRMGVHYHARMEALAAAEQLADILAIPALPADAGAAPPTAMQIEFVDVSFTYDDGRPALSNVSFKIEAGSQTALVGMSGSGKSTILSLLLKFAVPQSGRILIDGVDLADIDRQAWWGRLGWVPQKPHLQSGTIRSNIGADGDIEKLAKLLKIDWSGNTLDLPVGEDANNLSAGQVQRIALARALARRPSLLLMDEPTANLDIQTERAVQAAWADYPATRLVAAHRLETIHEAAQILVLDRGQLVASGTHSDLLAQSAYYRDCLAAYTQEASA